MTEEQELEALWNEMPGSDRPSRTISDRRNPTVFLLRAHDYLSYGAGWQPRTPSVHKAIAILNRLAMDLRWERWETIRAALPKSRGETCE